MEDQLFVDAARQLLRDHCTPLKVREIEAGESWEPLWRQLEDAGFVDALVDDAKGGAGLVLPQVFDVWALCGAQALPVPLAESMVARALLYEAGVEVPAGPIALAEGAFQEGGHLCALVRMAEVADHVLVQHQSGWHLLAISGAVRTSSISCLDRQMQWSAAQVAQANKIPLVLPASIDLRTLQACLTAAYMAGGLTEVFQMTLQYANDRNQFGRPIGKFQAIQHQLAVMSQHVFAARMAAQIGCESTGLWPQRLRVAIAKARCSQAALVVAEAAHAIHGAIGFAKEHDLQLFTRRLHTWRQTAGSESYWHAVAGSILRDGDVSTLDLVRATTDTEVS